MTLVGRLAAFVVVLLGVFVAVLPRWIYTELPSDLTLNLTEPTTIIVTGANSGLGLATVQHFAHNEQATIIMACRSPERCQAAKDTVYQQNSGIGVKATLLPMTLDLSDNKSIEAFAKELQNRPIHILINNAGLSGATEHLTYHEDGVEVSLSKWKPETLNHFILVLTILAASHCYCRITFESITWDMYT